MRGKGEAGKDRVNMEGRVRVIGTGLQNSVSKSSNNNPSASSSDLHTRASSPPSSNSSHLLLTLQYPSCSCCYNKMKIRQ
jgi:hypothetical protein